MDARSIFVTLLALFVWCSTSSAQVFVGPRSIVQSPNFRVYARNAQLANQVARSAEECRKQLANHWLGKDELPVLVETTTISIFPSRLVIYDTTLTAFVPKVTFEDT